MSEKKEIPVYKVTLSSGKVVFLREPKIADTELAVSIAGKVAGDNDALLNIKTQSEIVKILLVSVDGKELTMSEKESLDKIFTLAEFNQVKKILNKIVGSEEGNEPTMEFTVL